MFAAVSPDASFPSFSNARLLRLFELTCLLLCLTLAPAFSQRAGGEEPADDLHQYEFSSRPAPDWVKMVDLGEQDPALAGYFAPQGIKVEVVAEHPQVVDPVGIRFDNQGRLLVLEWREAPQRAAGVDLPLKYQDGSERMVHRWVKETPDQLKLLHDDNADGRYERASLRMDDLRLPSTLLLHDGWHYFTSRGSVIRRRQSKPNGPFDVQEEMLRGFCGFNQHQVSGLSLSPDGWLYITAGDDDDHVEGSDGARADLLRTGGVWQARPDGTGLRLFARGFRNPYRDVAVDDFGNVFHVDNDQEDGSKFQGCRLMHILEEADYGWRLRPGVRCCRSDFDRGAVFGERPGKMPSLLKTGRGAPAGLMVYRGEQFPDFFRGLVLYPDVWRKSVRAYRVERKGATFRVTRQFELLRSEEGLFRPCQAITGPDGAIYLCDWRTDSTGPGWSWGDARHGRIWRLSWAGTDTEPAIPLAPLDRFAALEKMTDEQLIQQLDSRDGQLRDRAADVIVRRGASLRRRLLPLIADQDSQASAETRASAMGAAARLWDATVAASLLRALKNDQQAELRRLAAELLGRNLPREAIDPQLLDQLSEAFSTDADPGVRRALALTLAHLAATSPLPDVRAAMARRLLKSLREDRSQDRFLRDGMLRALERLGPAGLEPLAALALADDGDDREFAVSQLEALRTGDGARALDRVLARSEQLTADQTERLLTAYRYIQVTPAIDPASLGRWLQTHADAPESQQAAALKSLALIGEGESSAAVLPIVLRVLQSDHARLRAAAIETVAAQRLLPAAAPLATALQDNRLPLEERKAIVAALARLRGQKSFSSIGEPRGVEDVTDQLAAVVRDPAAGPLRGDVLSLLGSLDGAKATPLAEPLIDDRQLPVAAAAAEVLGMRPELARKLAERFIAGKLRRELLPQVAAALDRHAVGKGEPEFVALRNQVLKSGLAVSLDPAETARIERLVGQQGDARRGRAVFLDATRSQCARCHRLEGVGGAVGPDLSGLHKTATMAKLLESIIAPSREVKESFATWRVLTVDGRTLTGLKISQDDRQVVLRDAQGRDVVLPTADIDEIGVTGASLMPDGVVALLTFQEFVDLIAFLRDPPEQATLRGLMASAWGVGPYGPTLKPSDPPERQLDPAEPVTAVNGRAELKWELLTGDRDGRLDLAPLTGEKRGSVYVMTFAHVAKPATATVRMEFEEQLKLLVNGQMVYSKTTGGPASVDVSLQPGWNTIAARVYDSDGPAPLLLSVSGPAGLRLSPLREETPPPAAKPNQSK